MVHGPKKCKTKLKVPPPPKFVCGTTFNTKEFNKTEDFVSQSPRRETYVQDRPLVSSVLESTPIINRGEGHTKVESVGFDSRISNIMPFGPVPLRGAHSGAAVAKYGAK